MANNGDGNGADDKVGRNKIVLTIVVNGEPVEVEGTVNAPLHTVIPLALSKSGNVGQPPENWELKDVHGNLLDLTTKIGDLGFAKHGTTLFLSLKAGVAGD